MGWVTGLTRLTPSDIVQETTRQLRDAWHKHLVLFIPEIDRWHAQQISLARSFGPRLAATEAGGDYRGVDSLADHRKLAYRSHRLAMINETAEVQSYRCVGTGTQAMRRRETTAARCTDASMTTATNVAEPDAQQYTRPTLRYFHLGDSLTTVP